MQDLEQQMQQWQQLQQEQPAWQGLQQLGVQEQQQQQQGLGVQVAEQQQLVGPSVGSAGAAVGDEEEDDELLGYDDPPGLFDYEAGAMQGKRGHNVSMLLSSDSYHGSTLVDSKFAVSPADMKYSRDGVPISHIAAAQHTQRY